MQYHIAAGNKTIIPFGKPVNVNIYGREGQLPLPYNGDMICVLKTAIYWAVKNRAGQGKNDNYPMDVRIVCVVLSAADSNETIAGGNRSSTMLPTKF